MVRKIDKNIVEIISIEEYTSIVSKYKNKQNVFYRGQSDKNYSISCSLSREEGYVENESKMISETLKKKEKEFLGYKVPIEILSKMQHYGIPTRLVDVTLDPYIALYFAIEEVEHDEDAEVFIFEKIPYEINSKDVKLVSLFSIAKDYSFKSLADLYENTYDEKIGLYEIAEIVKENKLVKFDESLSDSNERLYNQKGTFILCTNIIKDSCVKKQIKNISKEEGSTIIRIPFEYKNKIKRELNVKHNINKRVVYPELPVFAEYIKEKFKTKNSNYLNEYKYRIIEKQDISHALAKRLSIKIELENSINIDGIKEIIHSIVNEYSCKYDVLWMFVSSSKENTIIFNWTVQALWINENLSEKERPSASGVLEDDGIYWTYGRGIRSTSEYYEQNVFEEDSKLLESNYNELQNLKIIYNKLKEEFNAKKFSEFLNTVKDYKKSINKIYFNFNNFGLSKNPDMYKYLQIYQQIACDFDNITVVSDEYLIKRYFENLDENISKVESKYNDYVTLV